jgi:hypothetical protein
VAGKGNASIRLLKNTHLLRYAHPSSLRRTKKYASFLRMSQALHLDVFEQPEKKELPGGKQTRRLQTWHWKTLELPRQDAPGAHIANGFHLLM